MQQAVRKTRTRFIFQLSQGSCEAAISHAKLGRERDGWRGNVRETISGVRAGEWGYYKSICGKRTLIGDRDRYGGRGVARGTLQKTRQKWQVEQDYRQLINENLRSAKRGYCIGSPGFFIVKMCIYSVPRATLALQQDSRDSLNQAMVVLSLVGQVSILKQMN